MGQMLSQGLTRRGQRLRDMARALPRPETLLDGPRQRLDRAAEKLEPALIAGVQRRRVRLADVSGSLRPATLNRLLDNDRRRLAGLATRLDPALLRTIAAKRDRYEARAKAFRPEALAQDHQRKSGTLAQISLRLSEAGQRQTRNWRQKIDALDRLRETLSYKSTLARGYAVVRGDGAVITGKAAAKKATTLEIEFADGRVEVGGKAPAKKKTPPPPAPEQGTLL